MQPTFCFKRLGEKKLFPRALPEQKQSSLKKFTNERKKKRKGDPFSLITPPDDISLIDLTPARWSLAVTFADKKKEELQSCSAFSLGPQKKLCFSRITSGLPCRLP